MDTAWQIFQLSLYFWIFTLINQSQQQNDTLKKVNFTGVTSMDDIPSNKTLILNGNSDTIKLKSVQYGGLLVGKKGDSFKYIEERMIQTTGMKYSVAKGAVLKVAAYIEPPFVAYANLSDEAKQERKNGPGIVMEILKSLQKVYQFKYEFVDPEDDRWGEPDDQGNWNGLFGMLHRNEVDFLAAAAILRYDRFMAADYTHPFYASDTGMLIRSPDRYTDNRFLIVTAPFRWHVWAMAALAVVVSGGILKALSHSLQYASEVEYGIFEAIWVFFSVFVQQALPTQPTTWTCRTLLAFWWLAAVTLVASFTGNMVALFSVSRTVLPFNTGEEMIRMVQNHGYIVAMTTSSLTRLKFIQNSEQTQYKTLWYEMNVNKKWINVSSYEEGIELVKNRPNIVLLGPRETLQVYAASDCNVTLTSGGLIPVMYSIALQQQSNFTELFSHEISDMVEMGFVTKWFNDYGFALSIERGIQCSSGEGVTNSGDPIDLIRAQGAFWILLSGAILAVAAFIIEYLIRIAKKFVTIQKKRKESMYTPANEARPSIRDMYDTDSKYKQTFEESSRSYQPTPYHKVALPGLDAHGKLHDLKLRRHTSNSVIEKF